MRFRTDENVHPDVAALLCRHGHDAVTVWDQQAAGASDVELAQLCQTEERAFVTRDLGFADIRQYPPQAFPGLVVLRLRSQSRAHLLAVTERLLPLLGAEPLPGRLWIVGDHDVRVRPGEKPRD